MGISYPHVSVNVSAKNKIVTETTENVTATTLFVPFVSDIGPANEVKLVKTYKQFQSLYGDINPKYQEHLNLYNWLNAGGQLFAYRMADTTAGNSLSKISVDLTGNNPVLSTVFLAKNLGTYYNGIIISISKKSGSAKTLVISVIKDTTVLETVSATKSSFLAAIDSLNYIKRGVDIAILIGYLFDTNDNAQIPNSTYEGTDHYTDLTPSGVISYGATTLSLPLFGYSTSKSKEELLAALVSKFPVKSTRDYPIDYILDAGYSRVIKKGIYNLLKTDTYSDISFILDMYKNSDDLLSIPTTVDISQEVSTADPGITLTASNCQEFTAYEKTIISTDTGSKEVYVTPTYFLAQKIPTIDEQFPIAGVNNGRLVGVTYISENPDSAIKETYFSARKNYVEKDFSGYYFMSQRTKETNENALRFANNVRVKNRITKDLVELGKKYLFEFNDAVTLSKMTDELNQYMVKWIKNRALTYSNIEVTQSTVSDEELIVGVTIKFTGSVEAITFNINIE